MSARNEAAEQNATSCPASRRAVATGSSGVNEPRAAVMVKSTRTGHPLAKRHIQHMMTNMKSADGQRRTYRMVARAEAAEVTRQRVLDAAGSLFGALPYEQVSLEAVARQAGTTVQTILRRFNSKDHLLAEVIGRRRMSIHAQRARVPAGDVDVAVDTLFAEYEQWGDEILLFLAQEGRHRLITEAVQAGRLFHQQWVRTTFGPAIAARSGPARRRAIHRLLATTDLYVWKVLRRDLGLHPGEARAVLSGLVRDAMASERGVR